LTRPKHIKKHPLIPSLNKKNNNVTSDDDPLYNCIAFAAGITTQKWWPIFHPDFYWPPQAPRINAIGSFVAAFATLGYEECSDGSYEDGYEKVAFYQRNGLPTHAARQIGPGKWQSKLGNWYDIEHSDDAVSSGDYGQITKYLRRRKPNP
jgi:hypothetical protein